MPAQSSRRTNNVNRAELLIDELLDSDTSSISDNHLHKLRALCSVLDERTVLTMLYRLNSPVVLDEPPLVFGQHSLERSMLLWFVLNDELSHSDDEEEDEDDATGEDAASEKSVRATLQRMFGSNYTPHPVVTGQARTELHDIHYDLETDVVDRDFRCVVHELFPLVDGDQSPDFAQMSPLHYEVWWHCLHHLPGHTAYAKTHNRVFNQHLSEHLKQLFGSQ